MDLFDWKAIPAGIGLIVGVLALYWRILPEEKRYRFHLWFRLVKPLLALKLGGNASSRGIISKHFVHLVNGGIQVPYDVELEIWEPTDRWTVTLTVGLEGGKWITGNATKVTAAGGASENNPRWNKYRLKPPDDRKQIGYVDIKTDWQGPASDDECFKWRLSCLGVKIAEGEGKVPLQRTIRR